MSVCVNIPVETRFTTSISSREETEVFTRTVIYEPSPIVVTEYRCEGCKGSGGPDYCPLTPMPEQRTDMPCSNWVTQLRTAYPDFGSSIEYQLVTTTRTVPFTSVIPTETVLSASCTGPGPSPPNRPDLPISSTSPPNRQDPPTSSSTPVRPTSSGGPGSQVVVQPGTTPTPSSAPRTTAPQSSYTSVSTSIALSAIQVTVTANGSTLVRTSTSSYAVNATIIANAGINNANASSSGSSAPVGAIAGGVVGGILALLVIGGFLWWRKRKARREHAGGSGGNYWAEDDMVGAGGGGSGPIMANTYRASGVVTGAPLLEDKDDVANHVEPYVPTVSYGATSPPPQSLYSVSQASAPYGAAGVGAAAASVGAYGAVNSAASARNEKAQLMASYAANDAHSQASGGAGGSSSAAGYDTYAGSVATGSSQPQHDSGAFSPVEQYSSGADGAYPAAQQYQQPQQLQQQQQQQQQQQPTSPVDTQFGQRTSIHQGAPENAMTGFVVPGSSSQVQDASQAGKSGRNSLPAEPTPAGQGPFAGQAAGPSNTRGDDAASFVEMPPLYSPTA